MIPPASETQRLNPGGTGSEAEAQAQAIIVQRNQDALKLCELLTDDAFLSVCSAAGGLMKTNHVTGASVFTLLAANGKHILQKQAYILRSFLQLEECSIEANTLHAYTESTIKMLMPKLENMVGTSGLTETWYMQATSKSISMAVIRKTDQDLAATYATMAKFFNFDMRMVIGVFHNHFLTKWQTLP